MTVLQPVELPLPVELDVELPLPVGLDVELPLPVELDVELPLPVELDVELDVELPLPEKEVMVVREYVIHFPGMLRSKTPILHVGSLPSLQMPLESRLVPGGH
jgi:hypothetical protein